MKSLLILTSAVAALGLLPDVPKETETLAPVSGTVAKVDDTMGTISGKITFAGEKPEAKAPLTIKDKETVGCIHGGSGVDTADRTLMISADGGVANVVLVLKADVDKEVPSEPIALDQKGCRFEPHVLVVPAGATLRFDNSDETNHNIHTFARKNQPINKNVAGGSNLDQKVDKAETIEIKCDVHTWMKGYVIVTDGTSWAVSGSDGSFKLEGVPAGDYTVEVWHEELGKDKAKVTVKAGENTELDHTLGAKKKSSGGRRRR
jgi:plastocyanin